MASQTRLPSSPLLELLYFGLFRPDVSAAFASTLTRTGSRLPGRAESERLPVPPASWCSHPYVCPPPSVTKTQCLASNEWDVTEVMGFYFWDKSLRLRLLFCLNSSSVWFSFACSDEASHHIMQSAQVSRNLEQPPANRSENWGPWFKSPWGTNNGMREHKAGPSRGALRWL